jgi:hypothetical protein
MTTSSTDIPFLWPETSWPDAADEPSLTGLVMRCLKCDDSRVIGSLDSANAFLSEHHGCL